MQLIIRVFRCLAPSIITACNRTATVVAAILTTAILTTAILATAILATAGFTTIGLATSIAAETPATPPQSPPGTPLGTPPASSRSLELRTIERQPFAMMQGGKLVGFSVELWDEVARELGITYRFELAASFSDMLAAVSTGRADAAIANITITSERERVLDFSQPMFDAGIQVMVPADQRSGGLFAALFNWEMLGLLILAGLSLFIVGNVMWWFERRDQPYFQFPYGEGMWRAFWWALNLMVNGGFEERVPQTRGGRIFAVFLVIASLFLVSAFVAKITATLTVGELKSQINGYQDLFNRRVGTTAGSTSAQFLERHHVPYQAFENLPTLFRAIEARQLDAVVHDAPVLAYYVNTRGRSKHRLVGGVLQPEKFGIALATGSPLREGIDQALLRIREDGRYDELYRKWFGRRP